MMGVVRRFKSRGLALGERRFHHVHHELPAAASTSVTFRLNVKVADDVDDDGVYQVRIEPLGIATFGTSHEDALVQAEDAVVSYVTALLERNALTEEFERLGVEFDLRRVVSRSERPTYVEIPTDHNGGGDLTGRTLLPA